MADRTPDDQLTAKEVAAEYGIPTGTLANHRCAGTGPAYTKAYPGKGGLVKYRRSAIDAWLKERSHQPTASELRLMVDRLRYLHTGHDCACHPCAETLRILNSTPAELLDDVRLEHREELGAQLLGEQEQREAADLADWGVLADDTQAMSIGLRRLLATYLPTLETTP